MIPPKVYELCHHHKTLTSELAKTPNEPPHHVCKRIFDADTDDDIEDRKDSIAPHGSTDIEQALQCGNWGGSEPSELFLKVKFVLVIPSTTVLTKADLPRCPWQS